MSAEVQFVAYEGGQLRALVSAEKGHEAVLALPLSRLLVKMVRVPLEADPVEFCRPLLQAVSPFPDDRLTVSCETVRETEKGKVLLAAAFPENAADDIGEALDAAKLNVVRIDSLVLGQLRGIWTALGESSGRRLVLMRSVDCLSIVVLDGDQPSAIRAVSSATDLRREVMLSLLEAEDFGGARKLEEVIVVESGEEQVEVEGGGGGWWESLSAFAPVRTLKVGSDAALVGVAERSRDPASLNALPESWREVLEETRFKAKLIKRLAIAGGVWLLVMGVLFGVPMVYDLMRDHQRELSKRHASQYKAVQAMKSKVDLISKYSDHGRGALEIMRAVVEKLPEGIVLSSWDYQREDGLRIRGEADDDDPVFTFAEELGKITVGKETEEPAFAKVVLGGPNVSRGKFSFSLDCRYEKDEEE